MAYCTVCGKTSIAHRHFSPPLPAPPRGMVYGLDPGYLEWDAIRPGSNIEVPNFRPSGSVAQFPASTRKSKKLYERAVARALYNACEMPLGLKHPAVAYDSEVSILADTRLERSYYQ
jgi:hypothetical protein